MTTRSVHAHPHCDCFCFIAPPDLLAHLAKEGTPEQRDAALQTIASSASIRARRSIISELLQSSDTRAAAFAFMAVPAQAERTVYDAQHGGQASLPGQKVRGEGDAPTADDGANEAYDGAGTTYEFYEQVFSRNSIDGAGMDILSSVHFGVGYDNAFWNGSQMVYGDGSGHIFALGHLTKSIDVIGHELTHGVTQFTAGLTYHKQSGALKMLLSGGFILNTDDNPAWVKKIRNGCAFTQELRVRSNAVGRAAMTLVYRQRAFQLLASLHGHRAFFDHQLWAPRFRGNLPRYIVDRREVRLTVLRRWSTNTNEDDVASANRLAGISGEGKVAGTAIGGYDRVQVLFEDRQPARLQHINS